MMGRLNKSPLPSSSRLRFERLTQADAEGLFQYRSHPQVTRWQPWAPEEPAEARAYIFENQKVAMNSQGQWVQLGVYLREDGQLIGDCGIHFLRNQLTQVEVGITIAPPWQKQGYGTESLHALLQYLFDVLQKYRVIASVDPENAASVAMLEKVGMRKEAHHVRSYWFRGRWVDDVVFAMLVEEWRDLHAPPQE